MGGRVRSHLCAPAACSGLGQSRGQGRAWWGRGDQAGLGRRFWVRGGNSSWPEMWHPVSFLDTVHLPQPGTLRQAYMAQNLVCVQHHLARGEQRRTRRMQTGPPACPGTPCLFPQGRYKWPPLSCQVSPMDSWTWASLRLHAAPSTVWGSAAARDAAPSLLGHHLSPSAAGVQWRGEGETLHVPPQPVGPAPGRALDGRRQDCFREVSGEQRAWRRMGVLLVSKGKETAPSLLGGWQDEPKHPQLLLPLCWEESSLGEPGTQLPPVREWPPQL